MAELTKILNELKALRNVPMSATKRAELEVIITTTKAAIWNKVAESAKNLGGV